MSKNKRYYWLKLEAKFFNDLRIQKLRNISGGDTFTCIYLKLLILSLEQDGYIKFEGVFSSIEDEIATKLRESRDNVKATLAFCINMNMIQVSTDNSLKCEQVKDLTGSETASTIRSRKSRDKKKVLQCNTNATNCNTEKEIEKRIREDIKTLAQLSSLTSQQLQVLSLDKLNLDNSIIEVIKEFGLQKVVNYADEHNDYLIKEISLKAGVSYES